MKLASFSAAAMAPIVALAQTFTTDVMTTVTSITTTKATIIGNVSTTIVASTTTISATYANPTCDAGYIVDHCLTLTTYNQQDCAADDYACQCTTYQAIDTCFDNCPSDPRQHTYDGMIAQYCALAGLPTTNTALAPSASAIATNTRPRAMGTSTLDHSIPSSTPTANIGAKSAKFAGGILAAMAVAGVAVL